MRLVLGYIICTFVFVIAISCGKYESDSIPAETISRSESVDNKTNGIIVKHKQSEDSNERPTESMFGDFYATINSDNVNVRSLPDETKQNVTDQVNSGLRVLVVSRTVNYYSVGDTTDRWYKIYSPNASFEVPDGWVFGKYLSGGITLKSEHLKININAATGYQIITTFLSKLPGNSAIIVTLDMDNETKTIALGTELKGEQIEEIDGTDRFESEFTFEGITGKITLELSVLVGYVRCTIIYGEKEYSFSESVEMF